MYTVADLDVWQRIKVTYYSNTAYGLIAYEYCSAVHGSDSTAFGSIAHGNTAYDNTARHGVH